MSAGRLTFDTSSYHANALVLHPLHPLHVIQQCIYTTPASATPDFKIRARRPLHKVHGVHCILLSLKSCQFRRGSIAAVS